MTDDQWKTANHDVEQGYGRRRADARIPGPIPPGPSRPQPAHARPQSAVEVRDHATPLYTQLAEEWAARGAAIPCIPDPAWQRLASLEHLRQEIETTLRQLHLAGGPHTGEGPLRARRQWKRT